MSFFLSPLCELSGEGEGKVCFSLIPRFVGITFMSILRFGCCFQRFISL